MSTILAFDIYGTLIDTQGIVAQLHPLVGDCAESFSLAWRDKQLEYSFRRGLMKKYKNFGICTRDALEYVCRHYMVPLKQTEKQSLLEAYRALPAFSDVKESLSQLKSANCRVFAFSNGSVKAVNELLEVAGIRKEFDGIVSVDEVQSFKPDPIVYSYFLQKTEASKANTWLISSNSFDVIGALSTGIKSVWVRRSTQIIFDSWEVEPTKTVTSLLNLNKVIAEAA